MPIERLYLDHGRDNLEDYSYTPEATFLQLVQAVDPISSRTSPQRPRDSSPLDFAPHVAYHVTF